MFLFFFLSLSLSPCHVVQGSHPYHEQHVGRLLRRSRGRAVVEKGIDGAGRGSLSSMIDRYENRSGGICLFTPGERKQRCNIVDVISVSVGNRFAHNDRERMHFRKQGT